MKEWITAYDFRGPWAEEIAKENIRGQVNSLVDVFVAQARKDGIREGLRMAIETVEKLFADAEALEAGRFTNNNFKVFIPAGKIVIEALEKKATHPDWVRPPDSRDDIKIPEEVMQKAWDATKKKKGEI